MKRTIRIGAIQMDANPAPTGERLARAGRLVNEAAAAGARLLVLPELFNTGYGYSDANYRLAEPPTGPTVTWMREAAARLNVHLAGSLMLLDRDDVYNALLGKRQQFPAKPAEAWTPECLSDKLLAV